MQIKIRRFQENDIPYKVKWINDSKNNEYLHYELPLREDKTLDWFKRIKDSDDRVDFTITVNGEPVGIIGLLDINSNKLKAEYYITLGEQKYKGKGVANKATKLLFNYAKETLNLNTIYLFTEVDNLVAQKSFERVGFKLEKLLENDLCHNGKLIDRYLYTYSLEIINNNISEVD